MVRLDLLIHPSQFDLGGDDYKPGRCGLKVSAPPLKKLSTKDTGGNLVSVVSFVLVEAQIEFHVYLKFESVFDLGTAETYSCEQSLLFERWR